MLYTLFSPEGEETLEKWRKLNNIEFHNSYCSMDVIMLITSRRIRWARHAYCYANGTQQACVKICPESLKIRKR
jgi:hypothetical protein